MHLGIIYRPDNYHRCVDRFAIPSGLKVKDLSREFWLQLLACSWWALAARAMIGILALPAVLKKAPKENKILSDIVAACVYVCSRLAMMGFVFGLPLQGIVATSGVLAIVLGLALQNTLGDVFSGLSLSVEKPYDVGDAILLEGGVEGDVIQINWRSTPLRNPQNDVVIVPHSSMAKMRIQNHTALSARYNGSLIITVDGRKILKGAAMTCTAILEKPLPFVTNIALESDRVTYEISFSTSSIASAGEARSQMFRQLCKRARPGPRLSDARPIYFFWGRRLLKEAKRPLLFVYIHGGEAEANDQKGRSPFGFHRPEESSGRYLIGPRSYIRGMALLINSDSMSDQIRPFNPDNKVPITWKILRSSLRNKHQRYETLAPI